VTALSTLPHAIQACSRLHASLPAIVAESGSVVSYGQLEHFILAAARALMGHGIALGDRVALWAPNSAEWIIAALGVQRVGGVLVPLNTRFKTQEAQYALRASGARLLITVAGFLGTDYPALLDRTALPDLREIVVIDGMSQVRTVSWWDPVASSATAQEESSSPLRIGPR